MASNLPPGVTDRMIEEAYGQEQPYQTEKGWPRCACGSLLKGYPDDPPPGPLYPKCRRHGDNLAYCESLNELVATTDPETPQFGAIAAEINGCGGPMYVVHEYRTCTKCGAITRQEFA